MCRTCAHTHTHTHTQTHRRACSKHLNAGVCHTQYHTQLCKAAQWLACIVFYRTWSPTLKSIAVRVVLCSLMLLARILGLSQTAIGYESNVTRNNLAKHLSSTVLQNLHEAGHLPEGWAKMEPAAVSEDVTQVRWRKAARGAMHLQPGRAHRFMRRDAMPSHTHIMCSLACDWQPHPCTWHVMQGSIRPEFPLPLPPTCLQLTTLGRATHAIWFLTGFNPDAIKAVGQLWNRSPAWRVRTVRSLSNSSMGTQAHGCVSCAPGSHWRMPS